PATFATPFEDVIAVDDPKFVAVPVLFVTVGRVVPSGAVFAPENVRFFEPAYPVAVLPKPSNAVIVRLSAAPAVGVVLAADSVRLVAVPGATVKLLLVAFASDGMPGSAVACSVFAPAASIRRFVNDTIPFPAPVPMSNVVVPCNDPEPDAIDIVTLRLAPNPTVESFPNASCVTTTGCSPNNEPAVAEPGWVVNTSCEAAPATMS